jgi:hypothetical protein
MNTEIPIGNLEDSQEVCNFFTTIAALGSIYAVNKFNGKKVLPIESLDSTNSQDLFNKKNIFCFIVKKNFFDESEITRRTKASNNGSLLCDKFVEDISPLPERFDIFNYSLNAIFLEDKCFEYRNINSYDIKNGSRNSVFEDKIYFQLISAKKTEITWNLQLISQLLNIDDLIECIYNNNDKFLRYKELKKIINKKIEKNLKYNMEYLELNEIATYSLKKVLISI